MCRRTRVRRDDLERIILDPVRRGLVAGARATRAAPSYENRQVALKSAAAIFALAALTPAGPAGVVLDVGRVDIDVLGLSVLKIVLSIGRISSPNTLSHSWTGSIS